MSVYSDEKIESQKRRTIIRVCIIMWSAMVLLFFIQIELSKVTCPRLSPKYRAIGSSLLILGNWFSFSLLEK